MNEIKDAKNKKTVKDLIADAKEEVNDELMSEFKGQIKTKLASLKRAKAVVKNIERELEDLEIAISEKLE